VSKHYEVKLKKYQLVLTEEFVWRYYFKLSNTITIEILNRINIKKWVREVGKEEVIK